MRPRPSTATALWCGACKAMHPRSCFGKSKHDASGLANACKAAVAIRNRLSHARAAEKNRARHVALRKARKAGPDAVTWAMKHLLANTKNRAAARGWAFDLTIDTMPRPSHCPIFGVELVYQASGRRLNNSASLGRIDSTLGYTRGNVWVISWRANMLKSNATISELRQLLVALEKAAAGRLLDGSSDEERSRRALAGEQPPQDATHERERCVEACKALVDFDDDSRNEVERCIAAISALR